MYNHRSGVSFRKANSGDMYLLWSLREESWWGTHGTAIINLEDQRKWFESLGHHDLLMIAEKGGQSVGVGLFRNIDWLGRLADVSGAVLKDHREPEIVRAVFGCGVDFAFEILNLMRLNAEVIEYHTGAHKLEIDYLGFKIEGIKRKAVFKSGNYYNSIVLGLLKEDWEITQRVYIPCNTNFDWEKVPDAIETFRKNYKFEATND